MSEQPTAEQVRHFSPLDGLNPEHLRQILDKSRVESLTPGTTLFKAGDKVPDRFYLLSGALELVKDGKTLRRVDAGSQAASHALAHQIPRPVSARAAVASEVLRIDADLLDVMLTWDQSGAFEVREIHGGDTGAGDDDWMTHLLRAKALHRLPPANIQALFMRIEPVDATAGQVIIRQGEDGDYFYVVASGRCRVTRQNPSTGKDIVLADLGVGDSFGEEALASRSRRNATVTMVDSGRLMRLAGNDFDELLREPLMRWVDREEAEGLVANGAVWLDVRMPREFQNEHLPEATNLPLFVLRRKLDELDRRRTYVVCCDTGRRSSAAAYLLAERDFDARVLRGGLTEAGSDT